MMHTTATSHRSTATRILLVAFAAWAFSRAAATALPVTIDEAVPSLNISRHLEYFEDLVRGVLAHRAALDASLEPFLDRGIEEVDQIERAMLRISAYELQHRIDVPYRVIIDEALRAVKRFGSEHGHTYVNGVLDHAAAQWRALEMQAARGK